MRTQVTKRMEFCYAHYLPRYKGKCGQVHGHNAVLEVTVEETEHASKRPFYYSSLEDKKLYDAYGRYKGFVMDFGELKHIVQEEIISLLDHQFLNVLFDENNLSEKKHPIPTCESLGERIFAILERAIYEETHGTVRLAKIRLTETPNSWVEVTCD